MNRVLPLALLALSLSGCSFIIADALDEAAANIVADEGEGEAVGDEGEGEASEGEGEEGEGEEANDDDPACEEEERLLVARDEDGTDVFQVYNLLPGRFQRRFPEGVTSNVNLENDDPIAVGNGFEIDSFALGSNGRLYLTGESFLYQLNAATLDQQNIAAKPQLRAGGSIYAVQVVAGTIVLSGNTIETLPEGPAVGERPVEVSGQASEYHRSVKFSVEGEEFVAINAEYGYVVLSSTGGPLAPTVVYDEDFSENRFHSYGGGTFTPRGIAFDNTTRKLLLGDNGRVVVLSYDNGFGIGDPNDDSGDFILPNQAETQVEAIATRGGFAFVLFDKSQDNLMKLDLSQDPPVAVDVTTVATGSFGHDLAVGCRRVVVAAQNDLIAVSRDDLSPVATNSPGNLGHIAIVKRDALGLAGDD